MEEMAKMKGEIIGAVKQKPGRRGARSCGVVVIILFLLAGGWIAWTLAASGVVSVPFLSSVAYRAPEPSRVVAEGVPLETVVAQQASASSISITEATLTTELRSSLETSGQQYVDSARAQASVLAGSGIELFLPLRDNEQGSAIVVTLGLSVEAGELRATVESATVGSAEVGSWLREGVVNPMLEGALASVRDRLEGVVTVTSVRADEGVLHIAVQTP